MLASPLTVAFRCLPECAGVCVCRVQHQYGGTGSGTHSAADMRSSSGSCGASFSSHISCDAICCRAGAMCERRLGLVISKRLVEAVRHSPHCRRDRTPCNPHEGPVPRGHSIVCACCVCLDGRCDERDELAGRRQHLRV
jgi:hypothetical protein